MPMADDDDDDDYPRFCWVPRHGFAELENLDVLEGTGGRAVYAWVRLASGQGALWCLDLTKPPGQMQSVCVIEGA